jgi:hypothetical protein
MDRHTTDLDKRHFTIIEMLKKEALSMNRLSLLFGVHYGIMCNLIDAITYKDPCLVEDDNGLLSYVEIRR